MKEETSEEMHMTRFLLFDAALLVFCAVMLVTGIGATALWIAVIAMGVAAVALAGFGRGQSLHR